MQNDEGIAIGPYLTVGRLGMGGRGVVYKARLRERDGEFVALKTIAAPKERLLQNIRHEIHALAGIEHPGVVRLLDHGVQDGLPWYAMELVEGSTLTEYCKGLWNAKLPTLHGGKGPPDGPPSLPERALGAMLSIVRELCGALFFLHSKGIVHRDLKPTNILVRNGGAPVIVDFGFVTLFAGQLSRESLESGGRTVGTASYMSPEQIRGEFVDARADLYALGCILFELLTGGPPFTAETSVEIMRKHLDEVPPRTSELVDGIPPPLDDLVRRLMEKDVRKRLGYGDVVANILSGLDATKPAVSQEVRSQAYVYRPRFTGRQDVLDGLRQHLGLLLSGQGDLVLIGGESGVGKTRLGMEFIQEAASVSVQTLVGTCQQLGMVPFEAFRQPLLAIADRCRERGKGETEKIIGKRLKVLALYEPAFGDLPGHEDYWEPEELPADSARLRVYTYVKEVLEAVGSQEPVLVFLDDLQWADQLSLGFLDFLLRTGDLHTSGVLIVGTYRPEEAGAGLQRLIDTPETRLVELGRLDESSIGAMVADMLALPAAPDGFSRFLARHTEGNPFFVAEYIRTAVDEGILWRDAAGQWQVSGLDGWTSEASAYERLPLPDSLVELVERRLQGLSGAGREIIEAAAVVGRDADLPLLRALTRMEDARLYPAIGHLVHKQLLIESESQAVRFKHSLIRDVAYREIPASRQREWHKAAAQALLEIAGESLDTQLAELGRHWELAGDAGRARVFLLRGAKLAKQRYAEDEAERLYKDYLRLQDTVSSESIAARTDLGDVLDIQGRTWEAQEQYLRALAEARQAGDRKLEGRALLRLGTLRLGLGQIEDARSGLEQALAIHREVGDKAAEGSTLDGLAIIQSDQGRDDAARSLLERSLAIHRELGKHRNEGILLSMEADLHLFNGRLDEADALYASALAILQSEGNRQWEGYVMNHHGVVHHHLGRIEQAQACYDRALAIHRTLDNDRLTEQTLFNMLRLKRQTCFDLAATNALARQAQLHITREGRYEQRVVSLCELGHLALAKGESPRPMLDGAQELALALDSGPNTRPGQAIARLLRAVQSHEDGLPLHRGERVEDLPEGLRKRISELGLLSQ